MSLLALFDLGITAPNNAPEWTSTPNPIFVGGVGSVVFVNATARTKAGFAISSGIGIGDAQPNTLVTNTGSGTSVTLDNARWIYNGDDAGSWDLGYFGEVSDFIRINTEIVRTITTNYVTGVVVIDRSISFTAGDQVHYVDPDGVTVWDNRGANQ